MGASDRRNIMLKRRIPSRLTVRLWLLFVLAVVIIAAILVFHFGFHTMWTSAIATVIALAPLYALSEMHDGRPDQAHPR
jgi:polyferredoxin